MKFLHTADLHLGKQMNDLSLMEDQAAVLDQIVQVAVDEDVQAVLIAGDVYQRSTPQAEAMAMFDRFVSRLAEAGKMVMIISGNHDSAQRISYFSSLVRDAGVHLTEAFTGELQHVTLQDAYGPVTVWLMPFLRPAQVRRVWPEEKIASYQDAVAAVIRHAEIDCTKRNVLMCHQFVSGCVTCDSEEMSVGTLDQIDGAILADFDYVALGHIHGPQKVLRETMRYAGSPLKYSFSEARHHKSVTIVEMYEKGDTQVRTVPLYPLRDVRCVEGMLKDLMDEPYTEDYVWITIHDELPPPDAKVSLSVNHPNMLKFSVVNSRTKTDQDVRAAEMMEKKTVLELFNDFYRLQNNDQLPSEGHLQVLNQLIKELEEDPDEAR